MTAYSTDDTADISANFSLDPRLEKGSLLITRHSGCQIRLMNDSRYLWLIIIPEINAITDWHDLPDEREHAMISLTKYLSKEIKVHANADKINIASLGNMVKQFHLHLIVRHNGDAAWPGPVWGIGNAEAFDNDTAQDRCHMLLQIIEATPAPSIF